MAAAKSEVADHSCKAAEAGAQSEAEKAERRKAKKARQRAARAQAAAQTIEVRLYSRPCMLNTLRMQIVQRHGLYLVGCLSVVWTS